MSMAERVLGNASLDMKSLDLDNIYPLVMSK